MIQIQCPAKVNLFLEVTGRRPDGYHTLATLFAKIALFDVLDFELQPRFELEVVSETGQEVPAGKDNLVLKAAEAFAREFKPGAGARIRLTKRIPMGAGLGGGSSDAAGTLLGLARLYRMEKGILPALRRLAVKLGADVPVFLHKAPFCEGRGIGERLTGLSVAKSPPDILLVYPGVPVATKDVFGGFSLPDRASVLTRLSQLDKLKKKLEKGKPISEWEGLLFNRLEAGVLAGHPEVLQAKRILEKLGAKGVMMSGSGSSVFGFVPSWEEGEQALKRLKVYPWKSFQACFLG